MRAPKSVSQTIDFAPSAFFAPCVKHKRTKNFSRKGAKEAEFQSGATKIYETFRIFGFDRLHGLLTYVYLNQRQAAYFS
jgi:hypothetical protein